MTAADPRYGLLPDLPTPAGPWHATSDYTGYYTYTADQMLAYAEQCIAHARPEAVDEAMVERACVAHFNGMYAGGNGSGTAFTWEAAPESMKAKPRQAMHAALTAALTPERAP